MSETTDIIEKHITRVKQLLLVIQNELILRGQLHDQSKLGEEELPFFEKYAPKLKGCVYGTVEYKQFLEGLKPALEHHYANNRHHPEHFVLYDCNGCFKKFSFQEPNRCDQCGYSQFEKRPDISQMNLIDLCEMFCDWLAAGEQHKDGGNIFRSIEINQKRFGYSDEIKSILINTATLFKAIENEHESLSNRTSPARVQSPAE